MYFTACYCARAKARLYAQQCIGHSGQQFEIYYEVNRNQTWRSCYMFNGLVMLGFTFRFGFEVYH